MNDEKTYDVIIAGGGLVGGSLALALAGTGMRVALIEAVLPESDAQPSFDDRTLALSRGSCRILKQLSIWELLADNIWPVQQIHISQQGAFGNAMLDAGEQGIAELGFVIKSHALGQALWQRLREQAALEILCPARVTATAVSNEQRDLTIETADGEQTLSTRLLVVADGARSQLRAALGVGAEERDYEQVAVVANVQIDPQHTGYKAYERFTAEGPLAMLPGPNGQYTAVLARHADNVQAVMAMSEAELLGLLQALMGFRLGRLRGIGKRQAYPLSLVTAEKIISQRAVMIGNAAHGLHPVAAQGFNLGLRDVAALAETLNDARQAEGFDAGSPVLLQDYANWRQTDQRKVVDFTDGLIRLFGVGGDAANVMRGLSLSAFDMLPPVKRELARQTMGLAGRMSRLARGLPL
ncbi:MAG: 2-octaprenyl-6-methoxyphenyl hydroxylase [Gammaproteobacteria bacterium]